MNETTIARILRDSKPTNLRLRDGWIASCIAFARAFQASNECFDALAFLTLCDLSMADESQWCERYDQGKA